MRELGNSVRRGHSPNGSGACGPATGAPFYDLESCHRPRRPSATLMLKASW